MLTARRLRTRQAEEASGTSPANATPTAVSVREHQAALWELKKQHAEELERLRSANLGDDTAAVAAATARIAELDKENAELQSKLEALAKQLQQVQAPGADTTVTDTKPGAGPYGVTNEGAPLGEQNQAPAAAPLDNKGNDKLEPGLPDAIPAPKVAPADPAAPAAHADAKTEPKGGLAPKKK